MARVHAKMALSDAAANSDAPTDTLEPVVVNDAAATVTNAIRLMEHALKAVLPVSLDPHVDAVSLAKKYLDKYLFCTHLKYSVCRWAVWRSLSGPVRL